MKKSLTRTKPSKREEEYDSNNNEEKSPQKTKFEDKDLQVVLEEVSDHFEYTRIGGDDTFIALKNESSYAIGTSRKGLKVINDTNLIYSTKNIGWLEDLIYIDHLDRYLMIFRNLSKYTISMKDIDKNPFYHYMNLNCGYVFDTFFRYSKLNKRLIFPRDKQNISILNLERKQVDSLIRFVEEVQRISDFKVFGRKENNLIWITSKQSIELFSVSFDLRKVTSKSKHQIESIDGRLEEPVSLAVCGRGKHILVGFKWLHQIPRQSSGLRIYGRKRRSLVKLAVVKENDDNLRVKSRLAVWRCIGSSFVFVALSKFNAFFYVFDPESGELRELVGKRTGHQASYPSKIQRLGDKFYFIGFPGKVMRLTFEFN